MSFALDPEDDQPETNIDEKDPSQAISLGGGGTGTVGPGGGGVGGANSGTPAAAAKPSSSGSWTNLQSYMDANAGQGGQVGSQIAGTVSGQAQKAQDDVTSASSDFQNNVDANTVNADPDAVNRAITDAQNAKAAPTDTTGQDNANLTENTQTAGKTLTPVGTGFGADDVTNFQKQANANYGGPTDFTKYAGYDQAGHDINTAQQSIAETGSEAGRQVLLGNQYQNASTNGYNQGEKNLDQLLLENSPDGQATLQPLQSRWSGLNTALSDATTAGNAYAQKGITTDQATSAAAQKALADANTGFQSTVNNNFAAATSAQSDAYNKALADLKAGTLSADERNAMGLGNISGSIYNVDPTQYLSQGAAPTLQQSATSDQYAQAAALAKLAGQSDSNFLSSADASKAGTAGSPYNYDITKLNAALGDAKASYDAAGVAFKNSIGQRFFAQVDAGLHPDFPGMSATPEAIYAWFKSHGAADTSAGGPGAKDGMTKYAAAQQQFTPERTLATYAGSQASAAGTGPGSPAISVPVGAKLR